MHKNKFNLFGISSFFQYESKKDKIILYMNIIYDDNGYIIYKFYMQNMMIMAIFNDFVIFIKKLGY